MLNRLRELLWTLLFFGACLLTSFSWAASSAQAASVQTAPVTGTATESPVFVVAFAQDTLQNDFRRAQVFALKEQLAAHRDIEFVYSDAQGKTALLIHHINQFIERQVDVLIVGTNDAQLPVPALEKAHQQGIKVLVLDRGVNTDQFTSFINSDNKRIGRMAGEFIAKQLNGKGQVLLMEGILTADVTQDRSSGFLSVMAQYPQIKVVKRTGNFMRKDALIEMEKLISEGIKVDAIFSESDSMLSGIRAVLARHKIAPASIIMVGCDYTSEAQQAILAGEQTGSVLFPLGARATANAILELKAGRFLARHISIPIDTLVTADNVTRVQPVF